MTVATPASSATDHASQAATDIVRVAVPVPLAGLFDYLLPPTIDARALRPGMRVRVNFGRRQLTAVVIELSDRSLLPVERLRPISAVLDDSPCLDQDTLALMRWCAAYYHHAVGEVISTALTARLRQGKPAGAATSPHWSLQQADQLDDTLQQLQRAPRQAQLVHLLQQHGELGADRLNELSHNWRPAMQALVDKGVVLERQRLLQQESSAVEQGPTPGAQQQAALDAIETELGSHAVHLLHGVTGSGKTEVYIRLAEACIAAGGQVLLLVPEISLTPQLTRRFQKRLDVTSGILHSGLNDSDRHNVWAAAASGACRMLIGTRSAVFTPMPELALIIIDEEHDNSLKQQDGFRYHARDVALVRARNAGIPVVLGSATPSLESLHNARRQRYRYHRLSERIASAQQTRTALIDMRRQPILDGISDQLLRDIDRHLDDGNQVMLFINRRGYAPLLLCHQCGWTTRCRRCDAHMTYHQHSQRLRCHHCDSEMPAPQSCGECDSDELIALGSGTERIEQALRQRYPDIGVCRIDRDTTRNRGALEDKLEAVRSGEARIIVGTQMLAKGHDFPDVTLVGILDTDQALHSTDFRAPEHLAQLIIQVAGRAGRASKAGEVKIQTHHPDHPLLQTLLHQGYEAFCEAALAEREAATLPPFSHLALLRCEAPETTAMFEFMHQARDVLDRYRAEELSVFGPVTAPMERRAGRYRSQIMLQCTERKPLHLCLRQALPLLGELPAARKVRWSIDVDPVDTY